MKGLNSHAGGSEKQSEGVVSEGCTWHHASDSNIITYCMQSERRGVWGGGCIM